MKEVYLDSAAMHKPKQECIDAANRIWAKIWGNPSSSYALGQKSKEILEECRSVIAESINAEPHEIIFTSGGSEANTLAVSGYLEKNWHARYFERCNLEHTSLLENPDCILSNDLLVDKDGFISIGRPQRLGDYSIQMANSEIGTIQDIKKLAAEVHEVGGVLHSDATQAYGHIPINVKDLGVDMMTCTAQKIGGVPGCGFLYVRDGVLLSPIIHGHQEQNKRGGTENLAAIASFAKAVELINYTNEFKIGVLRNTLFYQLVDLFGKKVHLNGTDDASRRLAGNLSVRFDGWRSEELIEFLSMNGVYVSAGSACNSNTGKPSSTLKAIGLSDEQANSTIRITLSEDTTRADINRFLQVLKIYKEFK